MTSMGYLSLYEALLALRANINLLSPHFKLPFIGNSLVFVPKVCVQTFFDAPPWQIGQVKDFVFPSKKLVLLKEYLLMKKSQQVRKKPPNISDQSFPVTKRELQRDLENQQQKTTKLEPHKLDSRLRNNSEFILFIAL